MNGLVDGYSRLLSFAFEGHRILSSFDPCLQDPTLLEARLEREAANAILRDRMVLFNTTDEEDGGISSEEGGGGDDDIDGSSTVVQQQQRQDALDEKLDCLEDGKEIRPKKEGQRNEERHAKGKKKTKKDVVTLNVECKFDIKTPPRRSLQQPLRRPPKRATQAPARAVIREH